MAKNKAPKEMGTKADNEAGRAKALDLAVDQIEKQFGKGSIMHLEGENKINIETIPTGSVSLDIALPFPRTAIPPAFRYAPAVSRRTPVACSMRLSVHPSRPSAIICCFFSSLKTLLMATELIQPLVAVNVSGLAIVGRF